VGLNLVEVERCSLFSLVWLQKHIGGHVDQILSDESDNLRPFVPSQHTWHQREDKQLSSQKDGTTQDPCDFLVTTTSVGVSKQIVAASFGRDTSPNYAGQSQSEAEP
jgi:hypothetical protein